MSSAENKKVYSPSVCGLCKKQYTRLSSLNEHYKTKNIRKDGKLVSNPCYQANKQIRLKSLNEALEIDKHGKIENYFEFSSKKPKLDPVTEDTCEYGETSSCNIENSPNIPPDDIPIEFSSIEKEEIPVKHKVFSKYFRIFLDINENINSKLDTIIEKEDFILKEISHLKISKGNTSSEINPKNSPNENDDSFKSIRTSKSIADIMKNRLVENIFQIQTDDSTGVSSLYCKNVRTSLTLKILVF